MASPFGEDLPEAPPASGGTAPGLTPEQHSRLREIARLAAQAGGTFLNDLPGLGHAAGALGLLGVSDAMAEGKPKTPAAAAPPTGGAEFKPPPAEHIPANPEDRRMWIDLNTQRPKLQQNLDFFTERSKTGYRTTPETQAAVDAAQRAFDKNTEDIKKIEARFAKTSKDIKSGEDFERARNYMLGGVGAGAIAGWGIGALAKGKAGKAITSFENRATDIAGMMHDNPTNVFYSGDSNLVPNLRAAINQAHELGRAPGPIPPTHTLEDLATRPVGASKKAQAAANAEFATARNDLASRAGGPTNPGKGNPGYKEFQKTVPFSEPNAAKAASLNPMAEKAVPALGFTDAGVLGGLAGVDYATGDEDNAKKHLGYGLAGLGVGMGALGGRKLAKVAPGIPSPNDVASAAVNAGRTRMASDIASLDRTRLAQAIEERKGRPFEPFVRGDQNTKLIAQAGRQALSDKRAATERFVDYHVNNSPNLVQHIASATDLNTGSVDYKKMAQAMKMDLGLAGIPPGQMGNSSSGSLKITAALAQAVHKKWQAKLKQAQQGNP